MKYLTIIVIMCAGLVFGQSNGIIECTNDFGLSCAPVCSQRIDRITIPLNSTPRIPLLVLGHTIVTNYQTNLAFVVAEQIGQCMYMRYTNQVVPDYVIETTTIGTTNSALFDIITTTPAENDYLKVVYYSKGTYIRPAKKEGK